MGLQNGYVNIEGSEATITSVGSTDICMKSIKPNNYEYSMVQ